MAASGIAEHDEARRRERVYLQKAYLVREMEEARKNLNRQILLEQATYPRKYIGAPQTSTYDAEVQRMKTLGLIGGNDPKSQDRARRLAHYEQMKTEYSAKLPNRYSSTDYKSQW